jgi:hypothetical protein
MGFGAFPVPFGRLSGYKSPMRETFKSLPEDPAELRAVSELLVAEVKSQAYQIEKLKKELAGHPLPGRRFAKQICREGQGAFRSQI